MQASYLVDFMVVQVAMTFGQCVAEHANPTLARNNAKAI